MQKVCGSAVAVVGGEEERERERERERKKVKRGLYLSSSSLGESAKGSRTGSRVERK